MFLITSGKSGIMLRVIYEPDRVEDLLELALSGAFHFDRFVRHTILAIR